jgi:hypothetical protein
MDGLIIKLYMLLLTCVVFFLFIIQTNGYMGTGCPNAGCGFQPEKGAPIALGGVIGSVSEPGLKRSITIKIIKVH